MKNSNKSEVANLHQMAIENQIKNLKILIVDDLIIDSWILAKIFLPKMKEIVWKNILYASNGVEAVEISRNNPDIDMILMNIQMPRMNGFEAISKIRYFNKDVIIIIQTETAFEYVEKRAKEVEYTDYIRKPIEESILYELIKKYFVN